MFTIILTGLAALLWILLGIDCLGRRKYDGVFFFLFLTVLMVFLCVKNIKEYGKPDSPRTYVVEEVSSYQVDSTIVISGEDTLKTYTLTYIK